MRSSMLYALSVPPVVLRVTRRQYEYLGPRVSLSRDVIIFTGQRARSVFTPLLGMIWYVPAFFSCSVNSVQSVFIRSRSAIHTSACSCGGMASHRFSMFASVGLEMAWACRVCCCWHWCRARGVMEAASARDVRAEVVVGSWRSSDVRIILGDGGGGGGEVAGTKGQRGLEHAARLTVSAVEGGFVLPSCCRSMDVRFGERSSRD